MSDPEIEQIKADERQRLLYLISRLAPPEGAEDRGMSPMLDTEAWKRGFMTGINNCYFIVDQSHNTPEYDPARQWEGQPE